MKNSLLFIAVLCSFNIAHALELIPSILSSDKEAVRESMFSPKVGSGEEQKQFDTYTAKGFLPVYSERIDGVIRAIYIPKPEGCSFWTFAGMDGATLLKRHKKHEKEGFVLISCVVVTHPHGQEYWATWVGEKSEKEIDKAMRQLGISRALIKK